MPYSVFSTRFLIGTENYIFLIQSWIPIGCCKMMYGLVYNYNSAFLAGLAQKKKVGSKKKS